MKALTVKQPWAWAIVSGRKDVENRSRRTNHRGELLIHAGLNFDGHGMSRIGQICGRVWPDPGADGERFTFGAIIGSVTVTNSITDSWSAWAVPGYHHWLLRDAVVFPEPIACRGMLGLWTVPDEVAEIVEAARLAAAA